MTASTFPIRITVKKGEGMYIHEMVCEHCKTPMGGIVVTRLPFDCPTCNAPLLALCKMAVRPPGTASGPGMAVWQQFPPFPGTVDLKGE